MFIVSNVSSEDRLTRIEERLTVVENWFGLAGVDEDKVDIELAGVDDDMVDVELACVDDEMVV
eukprot:11967555-Heterocapsa_arctica.AAC.1